MTSASGLGQRALKRVLGALSEKIDEVEENGTKRQRITIVYEGTYGEIADLDEEKGDYTKLVRDGNGFLRPDGQNANSSIRIARMPLDQYEKEFPLEYKRYKDLKISIISNLRHAMKEEESPKTNQDEEVKKLKLDLEAQVQTIEQLMKDKAQMEINLTEKERALKSQKTMVIKAQQQELNAEARIKEATEMVAGERKNADLAKRQATEARSEMEKLKKRLEDMYNEKEQMRAKLKATEDMLTVTGFVISPDNLNSLSVISDRILQFKSLCEEAWNQVRTKDPEKINRIIQETENTRMTVEQEELAAQANVFAQQMNDQYYPNPNTNAPFASQYTTPHAPAVSASADAHFQTYQHAMYGYK